LIDSTKEGKKWKIKMFFPLFLKTVNGNQGIEYQLVAISTFEIRIYLKQK